MNAGPAPAAGSSPWTCAATGESDAAWSDSSPEAIGRDAVALLRHLDDAPAVLFTYSYTGASAVWAAAEAPELFRDRAQRPVRPSPHC